MQATYLPQFNSLPQTHTKREREREYLKSNTNKFTCFGHTNLQFANKERIYINISSFVMSFSSSNLSVIMSKIVSKLYSPHVLKTTPVKQKQRGPCRNY